MVFLVMAVSNLKSDAKSTTSALPSIPVQSGNMRTTCSFENEDTGEWLKHEYKEYLERYWKSVKTFLKSSKEREAAA